MSTQTRQINQALDAGQGILCLVPPWSPGSFLIRFGQLTRDEYFASTAAAAAGVKIHNPSLTEPPVRLKHFGPTPEAPQKS